MAKVFLRRANVGSVLFRTKSPKYGYEPNIRLTGRQSNLWVFPSLQKSYNNNFLQGFPIFQIYSGIDREHKIIQNIVFSYFSNRVSFLGNPVVDLEKTKNCAIFDLLFARLPNLAVDVVDVHDYSVFK